MVVGGRPMCDVGRLFFFFLYWHGIIITYNRATQEPHGDLIWRGTRDPLCLLKARASSIGEQGVRSQMITSPFVCLGAVPIHV